LQETRHVDHFTPIFFLRCLSFQSGGDPAGHAALHAAAKELDLHRHHEGQEAGQLVVLIGQKKALGIAVHNDRPQRRHSGLLASLRNEGQRANERLRHDESAQLVNDDEHGGCLIPMMMLYHEHDEDPEMRPQPISPKKREDIIVQMAIGLLGAYQYFRSHRGEANAGTPLRPEPRRTALTVGRNDPVPAAPSRNASGATAGQRWTECLLSSSGSRMGGTAGT
jgi:hypothetical protein